MSSLEERRQKLKELREAREAKARGSAPPPSATAAPESAAKGKDSGSLVAAAAAGEQAKDPSSIQLNIVTDVGTLESPPVFPPETYSKDSQTDTVYVYNEPRDDAKKQDHDDEASDEEGNNRKEGEDTLSSTLKQGSDTGTSQRGKDNNPFSTQQESFYLQSFTDLSMWDNTGKESILASQTVIQSTAFQDFLTRACTVLDRSVHDQADVVLEAALGIHQSDPSQVELVTKRSILRSPLPTSSMVNDVCFQPHSSEYIAVAYGSALDERIEGCVSLWSVRRGHAKPAFSFTCDSEVTAVSFSRYHPQLLIGGTYTGHIVTWDLRQGSRPVSTSFPSLEGHTCAVSSLTVVGNVSANSLFSCSHDGRLCSWSLEMTTVPDTVWYFAVPAADNKTRRVDATCTAIPELDSTKIIVGTAEGNVFEATRSASVRQLTLGLPKRKDRNLSGGSSGGIGNRGGGEMKNTNELTDGVNHSQAVTSIATKNQSTNNHRVDQLYVTSSMDGTCRVWLDGNYVPFDQFQDAVHDVKWSPTHPAVFAAGDAAGELSLWNLAADAEAPTAVVKMGSGHASAESVGVAGIVSGGGEGIAAAAASSSSLTCIRKVVWDDQGERIACGCSNGETVVCSVSSSLVNPQASEMGRMGTFVTHHFGQEHAH